MSIVLWPSYKGSQPFQNDDPAAFERSDTCGPLHLTGQYVGYPTR